MTDDVVPVNDFFDDLLESGPRPQPWWRRAYWVTRRAWEPVRMFPREVKWFIQRGRRGWSDRDTWGLDSYLAGWLPVALRHLKAHKRGIPMSMFDGLPTNEWGDPSSPENYRIAEARWDAAMAQMIAGFEAWQRIEDGVYESEVGGFDLYRPEGVSKEDWRSQRHARVREREKLRQRDQAIFDEGMALFGKHFGSLWD